MVVAMTREGVIGARGGIPWDAPEDRKLFQELTWRQTVVMGRKTYESIGAPLPERDNIVLSHSMPETKGLKVARTAEEVFEIVDPDKKIFVIGGAEVYRQFLPLAEGLHVSWIEGKFEGDTFFPSISWEKWLQASIKSYDGFTYEYWRRACPLPK